MELQDQQELMVLREPKAQPVPMELLVHKDQQVPMEQLVH